MIKNKKEAIKRTLETKKIVFNRKRKKWQEKIKW